MKDRHCTRGNTRLAVARSTRSTVSLLKSSDGSQLVYTTATLVIVGRDVIRADESGLDVR
jgi:hypothetical protein